MTWPQRINTPSRDTLDRLNELSERLVALSMVGANQRFNMIPDNFNEAYFDQMCDISTEVYDLCHKLDEDVNYLLSQKAVTT